MNAFVNPARGEIVIYHGPDGGVALDVRLEQETLWPAVLFERDK